MNEMRDAIKTAVPKASDIREITEYEIWIGLQPITVRLMDGGEDTSKRRYLAEAYHSDLPFADRDNDSPHYNLGHDEDTISAAISSIQWDKFV